MSNTTIMNATYALQKFQDLMQDAGQPARLMWDEKGPRDTSIAMHAVFLTGAGLVYVQAHKDGGWDAFTSCRSNDISTTIADVIERTRRIDPIA